jgi:hypothetical protein
MPTPTQFNRETLANLNIIGDVSLADLNVADTILAGSMWGVLFAQESSNGTKHTYEKETDAPTVGFRDANSPNVGTAGVDVQVDITLKILEATVEADKALALGYPRRKGGREGYMAKKGARKLAAAFHTSERQLIYGTGNDADGFVGLTEATGLNSLAGEKVIDAGGTGNDVESIWVLRSGEDDVSTIYNGESAFNFGDIYEQQLTKYDGAGAVQGTYAGLVTSIISWLGLQIGSKHSLVRVANVDVTANDVEDYVQDALALFPGDRMATDIFGSRRARRAIQRGRQKTSTQLERAALVTSIDGVPVHTSEGLLPETALT